MTSFRAALMVRNNEGLTKTTNAYTNPNEVRRHRGVAGVPPRWTGPSSTPTGGTALHPTCEFLLDYEDDDDDEEPPGQARRLAEEKALAFTAGRTSSRDEVLARLLTEQDARRARKAGGSAGEAEEGRRDEDAPKATASSCSDKMEGKGGMLPCIPQVRSGRNVRHDGTLGFCFS